MARFERLGSKPIKYVLQLVGFTYGQVLERP